MAGDRLDVIIFGASGFTGKYTVFEGVKLLSKLKWGVAGRSKDKLDDVLKEMGKKADTDLSKIPVIIADLKDDLSLRQMADQCKVLINCCGPYRFYGEPVVKACIEAGTHHVDVSGEPQYMEKMQLDYNEQAKEKGVYVVSACGFDSIPADLGTIFLENHFEGQINSIETYLSLDVKPFVSGASIHFGTWESAVHGLAHMDELKGLRTKLYKEKLPKLTPLLKNRPLLHKSELVGQKWCLPFLGSDRSVVMRSQRILYESEQKRPIQMRAYFSLPSIIHVIAVMLVGLVFGVMARFSFGRKLLLKYPKIFSAGFISHEGPSEEKMKNTTFSMVFEGKGWPKSEKLAEPSDQYTTPPSKKIVTKVTGTNPGYGATCVALLLAATTIIQEQRKMPKGGGVFPPGAAFAKTSLIKELSKNGFTFEVISLEEKDTKE